MSLEKKRVSLRNLTEKIQRHTTKNYIRSEAISKLVFAAKGLAWNRDAILPKRAYVRFICVYSIDYNIFRCPLNLVERHT